MSQFAFLEPDFPDEFGPAVQAEKYALDDPGIAVVQARKALELAVKWAYRHDRELREPYETTLNALINEPAFKSIADGKVYNLARKIQKAGNKAAHEAKPPSKMDAVGIVQSLHTFMVWFGHTYGREAKPDLGVHFDPHALPSGRKQKAASLKERQALEAELERQQQDAELARQRLAEELKSNEQLAAELAELRAQVAEAKLAAAATPIPAETWSEAKTRRFLIDKLLAEAGWLLSGERDREYEVAGMPTDSGVGFVDYVLWGDDGKPLGLVEAKRAMESIEAGREQAKLYADCLEQQFGQRPVIFLSNGYEHQIWDDQMAGPRWVQGFHTKDELALMIQRRTTAVPLADLEIDGTIVERYYQHRAIRKIAESFDEGHRKALVVMATGAGKTRTTIALVDLLMRANRVKRVLFLADRTALVNQAVNAFKAHLPEADPVNLVTEKRTNGRVYASTYQTMVGLIDQMENDGTRRFGVGHFDLVVIDEAHRSVYKKYRGIFEYFDSHLVGLTATPKDEVSKNTYDLFDLETGVPTDVYSLEQAISDGYLVPPKAVSVPLKFVREGVRYEDLSPEEQEDWDEIDWDDEGDDPPEEVSAAAINKWLFNEDTVDKVLENLMTQGVHVAGGDRLGKTIVFAKNQKHAEFIYERFNANYPKLAAADFARVITNKTNYAQNVIDNFSVADKAPHIAISVDMLDTGIDVPECVNLVFFKLVRSQTKFWQMIGRGTRLCPDLFGPGDDKTHFAVFDYCQNLEFFSGDMAVADPAEAPSLTERLWATRLAILHALGASGAHETETTDLAELLRVEVDSMNADNFLVRPHLQQVNRYRDPQGWVDVSLADLAELRALGSLPRELDPEAEESKRFDVLVLGAQLGVLEGSAFSRQQQRIRAIAGLLEEKDNIPQVKAKMKLILEVQTDEWWEDITYPMLESARRQLRDLVPLLEKGQRPIIYTDFEDVIGVGVEIDIAPMGSSFEQFRKKAEHFLKEHLGEDVVAKVRAGAMIDEGDIEDLQRLLVAAGVGDDASFAEASERAGSFGRFVRSIVGLDRAAAKAVFNEFLDDRNHTASQIEFVNLIIDELAVNGVIDPARLYDAPYVDLAPTGPDSLFGDEVDRLIAEIRALNETAG